uniref:Uncharacterized protein n=1 Tax=Rhizophora mucronata TaxID=61149 RepID=A0A2P2JH00_RHIMU
MDVMGLDYHFPWIFSATKQVAYFKILKDCKDPS